MCTAERPLGQRTASAKDFSPAPTDCESELQEEIVKDPPIRCGIYDPVSCDCRSTPGTASALHPRSGQGTIPEVAHVRRGIEIFEFLPNRDR